MCFFCIQDDTPFHLRKNSAFPRKMVAEAVEPGDTAPQSGFASSFNCDTPEQASPPSAWPKRKTAPAPTSEK